MPTYAREEIEVATRVATLPVVGGSARATIGTTTGVSESTSGSSANTGLGEEGGEAAGEEKGEGNEVGVLLDRDSPINGSVASSGPTRIYIGTTGEHRSQLDSIL